MIGRAALSTSVTSSKLYIYMLPLRWVLWDTEGVRIHDVEGALERSTAAAAKHNVVAVHMALEHFRAQPLVSDMIDQLDSFERQSLS